MFGRFENDASESEEQEIDESEIDYLEENTLISQEKCSNDISDYTDEELKELYDDFAGYINGNVIYENNGEDVKTSSPIREYSDKYKQTGIHKVSWGDSSVENSEQIIVLPAGTKLSQYSHEGTTGRHFFEDESIDYSELQLPDSQDKRILNKYEVVNDLSAMQSVIAQQYFSDSVNLKNTLQFKTDLKAADLVEQGILIKLHENPGDEK